MPVHLISGPSIQKCVPLLTHLLGFPGGSYNKESTCDVGDLGSIPGLGRSPGEGTGHSSILAGKIPWTEEPGGLQSIGSHRVRHNCERLTLE